MSDAARENLYGREQTALIDYWRERALSAETQRATLAEALREIAALWKRPAGRAALDRADSIARAALAAVTPAEAETK